METSTIATAAYQIPSANIGSLRTKVERLGRRCAKLGLPALALIERKSSERVKYRHIDESGRRIVPAQRYVLPCTWAELDGAMPLVEGYLFLARVEHTPAGNIISAARTDVLGPGYDLTAYRTGKPVCQHCKSDRRRKDTFVLRSPDGTLVQIGRNCLADFVRSENAEVAVQILALTEELSSLVDDGEDVDGDGFGGGWHAVNSTRDFLISTCTSVRKDGFRPSKFERSTKARASFLSGPRPDGESQLERAKRLDWDENRPTDEDVSKADAVLAWVATWNDSSDYANNVKVACALPSVSGRHEGVLASAVCAYERAMGREAVRRVEKAATLESAYQGSVKERRTWTLTVLRRASWDTAHGRAVLHVMTDGSGNCFAWKMTGGSNALEIGETYNVTGTVKKHEEYKGTKQTVLSRCVATQAADAKEVA